MKIITEPSSESWNELLTRPVIDAGFLESTVKNILQRVKSGGDKAIFEFNKEFDQATLSGLKVTAWEMEQAGNLLDHNLKEAIRLAAQNIKTFHASQKREGDKIETMPGVTCWRKALPIEKVGIYIPGGTAPLFSTVLMLVIPASLAGCKDIVLCTPPRKDGTIDPAILFTAQLTGATEVYKVGGAQAIAAMAYGTESIPQVYKIFGPGNQYVTAAKQLVALEGVAIDMPAGPSEVAILADGSAHPDYVAADLLSQAEHGVDSQVMLVSTSKSLVKKVKESMERQLNTLPRKEIAAEALKNSKTIVVKQRKTAIDIINCYAPEHLIIATEKNEEVANEVTNAGSVFLGNYTPEAAGDYASGTNHTLPTNGSAKAYSGVSLESFLKFITFQKITREGIQTIGPAIAEMAVAEQLEGHKNAISVRLNELK